ncbi:hypothetical protein F1880_005465 [Penicillium rolfsii]|nr:hypothetical protein F1880_005465 [Penicillium rolfsii]
MCLLSITYRADIGNDDNKMEYTWMRYGNFNGLRSSVMGPDANIEVLEGVCEDADEGDTAGFANFTPALKVAVTRPRIAKHFQMELLTLDFHILVRVTNTAGFIIHSVIQESQSLFSH